MEIISGYQRKCKNRIAGINKIWLLKYIPYTRSQVVTSGNLLLQIPESFIYEFHSLQNPTASQTMEENEGGKSYQTTITLYFSGSNIGEIELLQKVDTRMLVLDNNGIYRVYGLRNGLQGGTISYQTGATKADFNGFKIDLTGQEEKEAYFVSEPFDNGFLNEGFNYYKDFIMYG